jgi:two-component system OmpR family sensor kinase
VLSASGTILTECVFGFGGSGQYPLPHFEQVALTARPHTVQSRGSDSTEFRAAVRTMPGGEHVVVAIPLSDANQTINRLLLVEAIVILFVLAVLGVSAWLLVGLGLKPLDRMGETADAIAGGDLSHRVEPADPRTEIGRLGLALNEMLHRLEEAFKEREASEGRLRQFLADASHELRTPLVSIRGYAELYRLGVSTEPDEVDRSMDRIEQESARMGVLVEDMLTLARLDETHPRAAARVDVSTVVADATRDAEAAAPDRKFTAEVADGLSVDGDAHQLQQVLANLLRNASVHTPAGSAIEVSARRSGDDVRIDVRDHGKGLPGGAGDEIFKRFWRTEGGRERGKAGSGLGLAIVAEIVAALGGRVHAADADGGGAVFTVWLPAGGIAE